MDMSGAAIFKIAIILLLVTILISLASGLIFLVRDKGKSDRTVKSLTLRIVLSIALFILLFIGFATGLIKPHGINPSRGAALARISCLLARPVRKRPIPQGDSAIKTSKQK